MRFFPAIAILLTLYASLVGCQRPYFGRESTDSQLKIEAIAPTGEVTFPFVFQWKSAGAGAGIVYRVIVYDDAERVLFERDVRVPRYETPADLQPVFSSSRRFLWRVAGVDQTGLVVTQTPLVECTVR